MKILLCCPDVVWIWIGQSLPRLKKFLCCLPIGLVLIALTQIKFWRSRSVAKSRKISPSLLDPRFYEQSNSTFPVIEQNERSKEVELPKPHGGKIGVTDQKEPPIKFSPAYKIFVWCNKGLMLLQIGQGANERWVLPACLSAEQDMHGRQVIPRNCIRPVGSH